SGDLGMSKGEVAVINYCDVCHFQENKHLQCNKWYWLIKWFWKTIYNPDMYMIYET
ncbi:hypothetical protein ACJX0J_035257, partial [Zea mays]